MPHVSVLKSWQKIATLKSNKKKKTTTINNSNNTKEKKFEFELRRKIKSKMFSFCSFGVEQKLKKQNKKKKEAGINQGGDENGSMAKQDKCQSLASRPSELRHQAPFVMLHFFVLLLLFFFVFFFSCFLLFYILISFLVLI